MNKPLRIRAGANCYLLEEDDGFVLIDTGQASELQRLVRELDAAGCHKGDLRLVVITHADSDHTGNAVFLRETYGAPIGMHELEAEAARTGRMRCNRKEHPDKMPRLMRWIMPLAERFGKPKTFEADVILTDGQDLAEYGLHTSVLHLPGHTQGSLAILTEEGDLFCGDLFWNVRFPRLHLLIDDIPTAHASLERIRNLPVRKLFPGHGKPFDANELPPR